MSSSYYAEKIAALEAAKTAISGLSSPLSECQASVEKGMTIVEGLEICGEPMDKGKLSNISKSLSSISDDFDSIIAECDKLIAEYQILYEEAKAAEEAAAQAAAAAATTTPTTS